jgi:hypothetical protein
VPLKQDTPIYVTGSSLTLTSAALSTGSGSPGWLVRTGDVSNNFTLTFNAASFSAAVSIGASYTSGKPSASLNITIVGMLTNMNLASFFFCSCLVIGSDYVQSHSLGEPDKIQLLCEAQIAVLGRSKCFLTLSNGGVPIFFDAAALGRANTVDVPGSVTPIPNDFSLNPTVQFDLIAESSSGKTLLFPTHCFT